MTSKIEAGLYYGDSNIIYTTHGSSQIVKKCRASSQIITDAAPICALPAISRHSAYVSIVPLYT